MHKMKKKVNKVETMQKRQRNIKRNDIENPKNSNKHQRYKKKVELQKQQQQHQECMLKKNTRLYAEGKYKCQHETEMTEGRKRVKERMKKKESEGASWLIKNGLDDILQNTTR